MHPSTQILILVGAMLGTFVLGYSLGSKAMSNAYGEVLSAEALVYLAAKDMGEDE